MKETRTVTLEDYQVKDIQKMADDDAKLDGNFSAALRWIINEWRFLSTLNKSNAGEVKNG
jgi:hypothetical protein